MKIRILMFTVFMGIQWANAQDNPEKNPLKVTIIPPSPDAAAIGKYIDMPVSQYTGLPKIEVPIYELKSFELKLPINLSYHASGLKVDEIPSWVGAGWNLSAGGLVSRTIRGLNDERTDYGYFSTSTALPSVAPFFSSGMLNSTYFTSNVNGGTNCASNPDAYKNIYFASRGGLDLEPDLFFFDLPDGQSGKFVYDRDKAVHMIPKQYSDITYTNNSNGTLFKSFILKGRDGTIYTFEAIEQTTVLSLCGQTQIHDDEQALDVPKVEAPSTWKLTKIESASGYDWITLEYGNETQVYDQTMTQSTSDALPGYSGGLAPGYSSCANNTQVLAKRLKRIKTKAGYYIDFVPSTSASRTGMTGGRTLSKINIYYSPTLDTATAQSIKSFELTYSSSLLTKVQEKVNTASLPPFEFTYDGTPAPINSKGIDHWGYYNGSDDNANRIPAIIYNNIYWQGADREANLTYCKQGSLTQVKYPTGGTTELEYELNDYSNVPSFSGYRYGPSLELISSINFNVTNTSITYTDSKTFSLDSGTHVIYIADIPTLSGGGIPASGCSGSLYKAGTTPPVKSFIQNSLTNPTIEVLTSGNYTFSATFDPDLYSFSDNNFSIKIYRVRFLEELVQNNSLKGGGLRIKQIINTGDQVMTKSYSYEYAGSSISSGKLTAYPAYSIIGASNDGYMSGSTCYITTSTSYLSRATFSNNPLSVNQGSHVGYDEVTEYIGTAETNNGYSIYKFTNYVDTESGFSAPILPTTNYSYKNGLLTERKDYTTSDRLVKRTANTYTFSGLEHVATGIRVALGIGTGCMNCPNRTFNYGSYQNTTELVELTQTITDTYGTLEETEETKETVASTFQYNSYNQLIKTQKTSGLAGKDLVTELEYHPYVHTAVTKKYSYYPNGSTYLYKSADSTFYDATYLKPSNIYLMETTNVSGSSRIPPHALRLTYSQFDSQGNVLAYCKTDDPAPTALIWNVNKLFPVAQVLNATPDEIAHSSFEDSTHVEGGWTFSGCTFPRTTSNVKTGSMGVNMGTSGWVVTYNKQLAGGTYLLSYWAKNSNVTVSASAGAATITDLASAITEGSWTLYRKKVVVTSVNTELKLMGNSTIDELRLHPIDAQMSTYTYDVGRGITSATDINNYTTYYEYDTLNRLKYIRDFEGNILKRFEYHYQLDND